MITPCVTGLWNGNVLQAMADLGVTACVSDESVTTKKTVDYEPITPYHGVYSTVAANGYAGMFFVPRETVDIDYCDINDAMVTDEYNTLFLSAGDTAQTFEEIMLIQQMYAIQDKVGFRHDPFMFHQANAATFSYADPVAGVTHDVSLISLWTGRVATQLVSYFNLPLIQWQMDDLVQVFKQRQAMDVCGITVTYNVDSAKQITGVSIISLESCQMALSGVLLSGSTVVTETVGVETTSWINLTAGVKQTFTFSNPISV